MELGGITRSASMRLAEIDFLRAYAVTFVVVLHVIGAYQGMSPYAQLFFSKVDFGMGVDLFFVISGYVI